MSTRTAVNEVTGVSPYELVYGRKAILPPEARLIPDKQNWPLYAQEFLADTEERIEKLREVARKNSQIAQVKDKAAYDKRYRVLRRPAYKSGDLVLMRNLHPPAGAMRKVVPLYRGPYEVVKTVNNEVDCHTYMLQDHETKKMHPSPMNEFHLRPYIQQDNSKFKRRIFRHYPRLDTVEEQSEEEDGTNRPNRGRTTTRSEEENRSRRSQNTEETEEKRRGRSVV